MKVGPKSSLRLFLHRALQLSNKDYKVQDIIIHMLLQYIILNLKCYIFSVFYEDEINTTK